jgi:hypothetical protein
VNFREFRNSRQRARDGERGGERANSTHARIRTCHSRAKFRKYRVINSGTPDWCIACIFIPTCFQPFIFNDTFWNESFQSLWPDIVTSTRVLHYAEERQRIPSINLTMLLKGSGSSKDFQAFFRSSLTNFSSFQTTRLGSVPTPRHNIISNSQVLQ